MFWKRRVRVRSLRCFYCNQHGELQASGKIENWTCPNCEAINFLDDNGQISDTIPDQFIAPEPLDIYCKRSPQATLSSPFCQTCTSNHLYVKNALSCYLPSDDHPDYDTYEQALPAYKASLEERWPPICQACAPNVQARLTRNNYIAKSTALGRLLTNSKATDPKTGQSAILKIIRAFLWLVRGSFWWSLNTSLIIWFLLGALRPQLSKVISEIPYMSASDIAQLLRRSPLPGLNLEDYTHILYSAIRQALPGSVFCMFWNTKGIWQIYNPVYKIEGKSDYIKVQGIMQALRFFAIYAQPLLDLPEDTHKRLSTLFLVMSIAHILLSVYMTRLVLPIQIDLKDRATHLKDSVPIPTDDDDVGKEEVEITFGTAKQHPIIFSDISEVAQQVENLKESDTMDWAPSAWTSTTASSLSPFSQPSSSTIPRMFPRTTYNQPRETYFRNSQSFAAQNARSLDPQDGNRNGFHGLEEETVLAKQRFFAPEKPTGLESMFNAAVRLDDEPLIVRSLKSIQHASFVAFVANMIAHILLLGVFGRVVLHSSRQDTVGISGLLVSLFAGYLDKSPYYLITVLGFLGLTIYSVQMGDASLFAYSNSCKRVVDVIAAVLCVSQCCLTAYYTYKHRRWCRRKVGRRRHKLA